MKKIIIMTVLFSCLTLLYASDREDKKTLFSHLTYTCVDEIPWMPEDRFCLEPVEFSYPTITPRLQEYGLIHEDPVYDSEYEKMRISADSSKKGVNGFQGCVNKANCGYEGFYLAEYSREGLCDDCEFEKYPDRFVACIFCRAPNKKLSKDTLSVCYSGCSGYIEDILIKSLKLNNEWHHSQALERSSYSFLEKQKNAVERTYIKDFGKRKIKFGFYRVVSEQRKTLNKVELGDKPGIYLGAMLLANGNKLHAWTDTLSIDSADKKMVMDSDEAEQHVAYICRKYNVFGPETGEITLQQIPEGAITYEEKLS